MKNTLTYWNVYEFHRYLVRKGDYKIARALLFLLQYGSLTLNTSLFSIDADAERVLERAGCCIRYNYDRGYAIADITIC